MPPHGALYRSAIARMFRQCGKGKALYFEESRLVALSLRSLLNGNQVFVISCRVFF